LFFLVLAERRELMADRVHRKTTISGWTLSTV
jgi:hypothetical protein